MPEFKDMLKYFRKRSGLTQSALAEKVGLTRSRINNYEQGVRQPDFETAELFADFFNVDLDTLLARDVHDAAVLSPTEQQLVNDFRSLNEEGQEKVSEYAADLVASGRYQKKNRSLSMADPA